MTITVIGLDLAKNVFQVHGIDENGRAVLRRKIRRSEVLPLFSKLPPARVGMEACHTSNYWAREITKLGHNVRMMPAQFAGPIAPLLARHNNVTTLGGASFQMPPMRSRRQRRYAPMLVLSRLNANAAAWLKVGTCYGRKH
jgi:hypothetical protein